MYIYGLYNNNNWVVAVSPQKQEETVYAGFDGETATASEFKRSTYSGSPN